MTPTDPQPPHRPAVIAVPADLEERINTWHNRRLRIARREETGPAPTGDIWYDNDVEAVDLLHELCDLVGIARPGLTDNELDEPDPQ